MSRSAFPERNTSDNLSWTARGRPRRAGGFFSEGHYRQPLAYTRERLDDAARRVERIRDAGRL
jgi:cysteinyl-tRNA synthetase